MKKNDESPFDIIAEHMLNAASMGNEDATVKIRGFGTFYLKRAAKGTRKAGPRTIETVPGFRLKFRPSLVIKKKLIKASKLD